MKKLLVFMGIFALIMPLVFLGCSGDDGAQGPQGVAGPPGPSGADVTLQDLAALGLVYSSDVTAINPVLDLSQTVSYNAGTGALSVHFFLKDEDGDGIDITKIPYEVRVYVSELIPAPDNVAVDPGPAWDQLFSESGTPALATSPMPGTLTLVDAATGEYTYTCNNTVAASANVIRVTMRARFRFRDNNNVYVVVANPVNASYDFLQAAPGTPLASSGADMVTTAACESCHGARIGNVGHGGGYTQVKTCNHCHNLNYMATRDLDADLAFMVHRIHDAGVFALDNGTITLGDFSEVTYPQHINTCGKCHVGPEAALALSNPTRRNCGSCHDAVDFATGTGHVGGAQANDTGCAGCHPSTAIPGYHNPAPAAANTPEFNVTITLTPAPANGTHYVAGDNIVVTVTLADGVGPVPGTVYTTGQDGEGVANLTAGLSEASLRVYGPRNEAIPRLTTDTIDDPAFVAPATQGHELFVTVLDNGVLVPNPDPLVTTDANGFSYQLLTIPAGMEAGTYMVHFEGADYGGVTDNNYVTSSTADITFQVGTATVEPKVSGDACLDCHGATRMHLEGSHAHNVPFDTDTCLACHDKSGNYGDYIGNRVHAVHRASVTGDTHSRDWFEVTYPQEPNNCTKCHTNTAIDTPVWRTPSMLACGGCHGTDVTADWTDPAYYTGITLQSTRDRKEAQILTEVGAAQHMAQNGGDLAADELGAPPTLSCLICHGEGRVADTYVTHQLIRFRPLPEDPNQ